MVKRLCIAFAAVSIMFVSAGNAIAQSPRTESEHLSKTVELYESGQYRASQQELRKARENAAAAELSDLMRIDYLSAQCAAKLGEDDALSKIAKFTDDYPGSIYASGLRLTGAGCLFDEERYADALAEYRRIDGFGLHGAQRDEYYFRRGYSEFMTGDLRAASASFRQVGTGSDYAPHAKYYTAYIDYTEQNYAAAKRGFAELASDPAYGKIIPFYLLQIEFLKGNYDYVTAHGDALMRVSEGSRTSEIARIMAESWFHKGDYAQAMHYIDLYRTHGGTMDRQEYYLAGYSEYMLRRPTQAVEALSHTVGPADRLSQNAAYHMAAAYLDLGRKREAMQSFSIAADGGNASATEVSTTGGFDAAIRKDALFNYGKLQFELGGGVFNEAINVLQRYVSEYPQSVRMAEATEYLASAYYNSRNYDAAYEAIKRIPNPDNNIKAAFQKIAYFRALDLYNSGNYADAYAMLGESLRNASNPKYNALAQFWMGEIRYLEGDYAAAAKHYRDYTGVAPASEREHKMALYNLGYSYFNRQMWSDARSWFDKFIAAYPTRDRYRADTYNRLGDIDFANREFWRAIEMYDNAAKIGTDEKYYSQFQRAMMLGYVGRPERKIESMNEIIRAGRGGYTPDAMYELGLTYISLERFRDAAAAMKRFTDAYPNDEKYTAALSDLGLIYQNLNDNATAAGYYKMVVEKAPNSPEAKDAMLALKGIYVDMNDVDAYFAFAQRTGTETDLTAVSRDSLAFAAAQKSYLQHGNSAASITALKNYLDRYPRGVYRADALYYIGDSYAAAGRGEEAAESYKELAAMYHNPHTASALEKLASLQESMHNYKDAAETYARLSEAAADPATVAKALAGRLANTIKVGSDEVIERVADEIATASGAPDDLKREARFIKAGIVEKRGDTSAAQAIYRDLATESRTAAGAKSTLKVIQSRWAQGDLDGAQKMIMAFAQQNTPHQYELGRAFLILGDIYAKKGDTFQARATLQSIIDGYSPDDDGIITEAKKKIEKL